MWPLVALVALLNVFRFFADGQAGLIPGLLFLNTLAITAILIGVRFSGGLATPCFVVAGICVLMSVGLLIHKFPE